jgi:hypothetical protein
LKQRILSSNQKQKIPNQGFNFLRYLIHYSRDSDENAANAGWQFGAGRSVEQLTIWLFPSTAPLSSTAKHIPELNSGPALVPVSI